MKDSNCSTGRCTFPIYMWEGSYLARASGNAPDLPTVWRNLIKLPEPPESRTGAECAYLFGLKAERDARKSTILKQAHDVFAATEGVREEVKKGMDAQSYPRTFDCLDLIFDNLEAPIFYTKLLFSRGRPFMCCNNDIDPMFKECDPLYPAHPAYPSGHSTQAHAVAYFFARLRPRLTDSLMAAAFDVARNREVAGLHYPSDSVAGKLLAGQVMDLLFASAGFASLATEASNELP